MRTEVVPMRARNIASRHHTVAASAPATEAAAILSRVDVRAVLVTDVDGDLAGVLSDSLLLAALLPDYVEEDEALARVMEEGAVDLLHRRLEGRTVSDLLDVHEGPHPEVAGDARLLEVAAMMVRTGLSLVGVRDEGRLIGGISIDDLLTYLLRGR
jgi:CBS domain-containing protein